MGSSSRVATLVQLQRRTAARRAAAPSSARAAGVRASSSSSFAVRSATSPVVKLARCLCSAGYSASRPSAISASPEWRATSGGEPEAAAQRASVDCTQRLEQDMDALVVEELAEVDDGRSVRGEERFEAGGVAVIRLAL